MAQYLMSDTDGNIVINNVNILGYVDGTGYVRLNGSNIEIGGKRSIPTKMAFGSQNIK